MKKSSRKILETSKLLSICRKLKAPDLLFLYENMRGETRNLFSELVYNVLHNTNSLKLSHAHARKIRKMLLPHKKEFEFLAKSSGSDARKTKIMKKQIGGGVITALVSTLAPIIISLIAGSGGK